jgi:hypothetical protein
MPELASLDDLAHTHNLNYYLPLHLSLMPALSDIEICISNLLLNNYVWRLTVLQRKPWFSP